MLFELLTLLPTRLSEDEISFHRAFVQHTYNSYYNHLLATGYRDRAMLDTLKETTAYSMGLLRWRQYDFWKQICEFRDRAWHLKKAISDAKDIPVFPFQA